MSCSLVHSLLHERSLVAMKSVYTDTDMVRGRFVLAKGTTRCMGACSGLEVLFRGEEDGLLSLKK